MAHCAARVASQWPGKPLFLYVLEGNTQAREFYRRLGGVESDSFNDPFPGTDLMVAIRRVTWTTSTRWSAAWHRAVAAAGAWPSSQRRIGCHCSQSRATRDGATSHSVSPCAASWT
jgi:hypothetical protein